MILRQTRMPITLLKEHGKQARVHVLDTEPFETTFGKKAQRKRANVRAENLEVRLKFLAAAVTCVRMCSQTLAEDVEKLQNAFVPRIVDPDAPKDENPNPLFKAGQSQRIWGELYKARLQLL